MPEGLPGYLALDDKIHRFDRATWWLDSHELHLEGEGRRCFLSLVGVPFPGVSGPQQLVGKSWAPGEDEFSPYDDIFAEGGLEIRGERYTVVRIRVDVRSFNPESRVLKAAVQMSVEGEDSGYSGEVDAQLACEWDSPWEAPAADHGS